MSEPTVLIVEDGDEYLENLSRFVPGPRYLQAHSGAEALELLGREPVDLIYLDMRFDRIPTVDLLGDHAAATREHNGDPVRAWRHLQMNQGLFVLDAIRRAGHGALPVILAYDFSRERKRYERLAQQHPTLRWVPDAVTPSAIRELMEQLLLGS
jgi:CheY-like chemotaxis protein